MFLTQNTFFCRTPPVAASGVKLINYFNKKPSSEMFDKVLSTSFEKTSFFTPSADRCGTSERVEDVSPALFSKLMKKAQILGKKYPDCVHLWAKFKFIQEKESELFACGTFLLCAVGKTFIEVPLFQKTSLTLKNS